MESIIQMEPTNPNEEKFVSDTSKDSSFSTSPVVKALSLFQEKYNWDESLKPKAPAVAPGPFEDFV